MPRAAPRVLSVSHARSSRQHSHSDRTETGRTYSSLSWESCVLLTDGGSVVTGWRRLCGDLASSAGKRYRGVPNSSVAEASCWRFYVSVSRKSSKFRQSPRTRHFVQQSCPHRNSSRTELPEPGDSPTHLSSKGTFHRIARFLSGGADQRLVR